MVNDTVLQISQLKNSSTVKSNPRHVREKRRKRKDREKDDESGRDDSRRNRDRDKVTLPAWTKPGDNDRSKKNRAQKKDRPQLPKIDIRI